MNRELKHTSLSWINDIPTNWRIIPNKYIFSKTKTIIGKYHGEPVLSLTINGVKIRNDNEFKGKKTVSYDDYQICHPGNLLMCLFDIDVTPRCIGLVENDGITTSAYTQFEVAQDNIPQYYYYYYLNLDYSKTLLHLSRNIRSSLTPDDFGRIYTIQPPFLEQQAIVAYLDSKCAAIDEAIERHKKIIEKLEEYKHETIITSVAGDLSGETKESNIPWMKTVPSNWDIIPMRFMMIPRKHKNDGLIEKNLLTLSYGKIKRKNIETNEGLVPASFEGYNIVEAGDIVMRLIDLQNDKHSLRTGLVTERGIITSAYVTVTPIEGFNSAYCRYLLHAYDLLKVFYTMGEGIRQSLTYDDVSRNILILKPPLAVQEKIANSLALMEVRVDYAIERQNGIIEKLEEYRKSIIYNAVTGKIDCREATK